jgi:hypothetical protein
MFENRIRNYYFISFTYFSEFAARINIKTIKILIRLIIGTIIAYQ